MADVTRISAESNAAATGASARRRRHGHDGPSFQQVLARAHHDVTAPQLPAAHRLVIRAAARVPVKHVPRVFAAPAPTARVLPAAANAALTQAMARENVPESWRAGLSFIMAQESGGKVDARNPVHSARGLYQLTRANWHLNPHGAASFGNAVEEAQGGIRYIRSRYGDADKAVAFWHQHHWY